MDSAEIGLLILSTKAIFIGLGDPNRSWRTFMAFVIELIA